MLSRTQITLDPELRKKARDRAAEMGVSLAEYIRRLVARDLAGPEPDIAPSAVFDLGNSEGSDIARHKDEMIGEAAGQRRH